MALFPYWGFHGYDRPSRIINQHFGSILDPEDIFEPLANPTWPFFYNRPWRTLAQQADSGSVVNFDKDKFQVNLDVQQFLPNEINVKVTGDNTITVEGKHEEKEDEHGYISRHFVRKYVLPKGHDIDKIESKLSSDGVLTITAPKIDSNAIEHRTIPIVNTGKPLKIKEKEGKNEEEKKK